MLRASIKPYNVSSFVKFVNALQVLRRRVCSGVHFAQYFVALGIGCSQIGPIALASIHTSG